MHAPTMLASLLPLLPLTLALPLESRAIHEFDITALSAKLPVSGTYGTGAIDSSISITVNYPDASSTTGANLTTTCSYAWPASITPGPTNWTQCTDPALQWRLPEKGWTSTTNYRVEVYQSLTDDAAGAGLDATHYLDMNPSVTSDPSAYLSCIQMGKFTPLICQLSGPLSAHPAPVVMYASEESTRPE
ncbi:hypothetical protein F5B20DRAFT_427435 [Whalleya microplaca]|nr:hypothetical protein F5B20DRAFT_427435 [Whalleya microplaca]